jgi:uncharacterized protein (DUF111 family)
MVMKDKILERIEALAKEEFETPIEDVMRRGIDALERELDAIDLSRFITELRRMKSGLPEARKRLYEGKSMEQIRKERQKLLKTTSP